MKQALELRVREETQAFLPVLATAVAAVLVAVAAAVADVGGDEMRTKFAQALHSCRNSKTVVLLLAFVVFGAVSIRGTAQEVAQMSFTTPDEAANALLQALKTDDIARLKGIFGPDAQQAFSSGDPILDSRDREVIALAIEQSRRWVRRGVNQQELMIGDEVWPFPVPLVKKGNAWRFDTKAGTAEVLARRIGRNELAVIELCRAYVLAQREYSSQARDGKPAGLFAQKIRSTPGRQDGLYWNAKPGELPSPLGNLVAEAATEGYDTTRSTPAPFWGYHFRILNGQGKAAPGGAKSYLVNGEMSRGFALLAYPAKYGHSGVMTFTVNQSGVVYEKDLGQDTAKVVAGMNEYNPNQSWKKMRVP